MVGKLLLAAALLATIGMSSATAGDQVITIGIDCSNPLALYAHVGLNLCVAITLDLVLEACAAIGVGGTHMVQLQLLAVLDISAVLNIIPGIVSCLTAVITLVAAFVGNLVGLLAGLLSAVTNIVSSLLSPVTGLLSGLLGGKRHVGVM